MTVSNIYGQKTKYRITLELDVQDDFNPRQIDWDKVLGIQENECCHCYIEDLNLPLGFVLTTEATKVSL
jgi:hypothetical protein